ncbi:MAG TPA: UPF0175 family protein [Armatimonadota bacterium]|nr:UPF0175 family protein [Armatimonadota bacterium]
MPTKTVKTRVEVPGRVSEAARENAERQAHESAVLSLWQAGEISTREAAAELGLTYHDYLDLLAARGIPVVQGSLNLEAIEEAERKLVTGSVES